MTLRILIDSIADNIGQPFNEVLKERLKYSIISSRAILLRREYDKTKVCPESSVYEIRCIDMIDVDAAECCDGLTKLNCTTRKTKDAIPNLLYFKDQVSSNFRYVGSPDKKHSFQYILPEQIAYFRESKFTKNLPRFTFINNHIYVFNTSVKEIIVRAAFANPLELIDFCGLDIKGCLFDSDNVEIEDHLVDPIKDLTYRELGINKTMDKEIKINEE